MEMLSIHQNIKKKLNYFIENMKIPHILFYGPSGAGKRVLVYEFINNIYKNNKEKLKSHVMSIDCAHGKGIKFIREELKFFSKTNITNKEEIFKSILLLNADKLTNDAQSALRRCIELYSCTTRFFIVIEDKFKLLNPILSRFCDIHIPLPVINKKQINLNIYNLKKNSNSTTNANTYLKNKINNLISNKKNVDNEDIVTLSEKLYEKGYSGNQIADFIDSLSVIDTKEKYIILFVFNKLKKELKNEKIIIFSLLSLILFRSNDDLENISFM
jgi:DNA polymerase III delta prime subunit